MDGECVFAAKPLHLNSQIFNFCRRLCPLISTSISISISSVVVCVTFITIMGIISYEQFVQNSVNSCEYSQTVNGKGPMESEKLITRNVTIVIHRV